jgi:NTP pyrophosphatase (non-canonical NTP hydrolase)
MDLNEYQNATSETAQYPDKYPISLLYCALKLASEAGEFTGKIGKSLRGDAPLDREALVYELGDVLWYVAQAAKCLDYSLENIAAANLEKLTRRAAAGTIKGDGDNR